MNGIHIRKLKSFSLTSHFLVLLLSARGVWSLLSKLRLIARVVQFGELVSGLERAPPVGQQRHVPKSPVVDARS